MTSLKILQIKKSSEFKQISKKNQKFHSHSLILLSVETPEFYFQDQLKHKNAKDFCRVGYTVSKAVGNAVIRNQAKRRLREAFKKLALSYANNLCDYVLIARKEIAGFDYQKIFSDLRFCLKNIHQTKFQTNNFSRDASRKKPQQK